MKSRKLPQFQLDLVEEIAYLSEQASPATARRFAVAVRHTVAAIARQPGSGRPRHDLVPQGMRSPGVQGFRNWLIFYQQTHDALLFLRLKHGAMHLPALFSGPQVPVG